MDTWSASTPALSRTPCDGSDRLTSVAAIFDEPLWMLHAPSQSARERWPNASFLRRDFPYHDVRRQFGAPSPRFRDEKLLLRAHSWP